MTLTEILGIPEQRSNELKAELKKTVQRENKEVAADLKEIMEFCTTDTEKVFITYLYGRHIGKLIQQRSLVMRRDPNRTT